MCKKILSQSISIELQEDWYSLIDKFAWGSNDGFAVLVEEWGEASTVAVLCKQIVNTSLGIDDDTCIL